MKTIYNFFKIFPLFILLISPEHSIQTSLHLEKKSCHTIYLCKTYLGLGVADWIMIIMSLILFFFIFLKKGIIFINKNSTFYKVTLVSILYLIIGAVYNIFVQYHLISYLYDFKIFLYFIVIYYWLQIFCKFKFSSKHLIYIFLIMAIGSLWDYIYVINYGVVQRPNLISFMPVMMPMIDPSFVILLMVCFKQHRWWLSFFLIFELLSLFNQATLGGIYGVCMAIMFILLYQRLFKEKLLFTILILSYLFILVALPLFLYEILPYISDIKSSGLDIRKMKTLSLMDNFFINIPILIGKGLGSTYFETVTSSYTNIFSTGVNHTEGNVKFVMHTPLALFYKFGLIGSMIMIFILLKTSIKLFLKHQFQKDNLAYFLSVCFPIFIMGSLISPGIIKNAILAAIFIFISDQKIVKIKNS
jgi:hypothetical protein